MASLDASKALAPVEAAPASPAQAAESEDAATPKSPVEVPSNYETKAEVQAMLASPKAYKRFLKRTKCAQCGAKCMDKRFGPISALVVLSMIDSFWCSACGRLLCDKHRSLHTCEKQDFLNAKQRSKTAEQIKAEVEAAALRKEQAADEAASMKAAAARDAAEQFAERKARRKAMAGKSNEIANFLQRQSLAERLDARTRQEMLRLYTKANRCNLELWNEFDTPTSPGTVKTEPWVEAKECYERGSQLCGMVIVGAQGETFETRFPWEEAGAPPPEPQP